MLNKEQVQQLQNEYVQAKYNELKAKTTKAIYTAIFRGQKVVEVRCYEPHVLCRTICKMVVKDLQELGYISARFVGNGIIFALDGQQNDEDEWNNDSDNNNDDEWNDDDEDDDED